MNPALRVVKNTAALSLSVLLERGVAMFLPWYVARVQGKEVWGCYSTALAFINIAYPLGRWGLRQLLPREIVRDRARVGAFLANAGVIGGAVSILATAIAVAIVHFLDYPAHVQRLIHLGVILTLLPLTESMLCEAAINGLEKMEWIVVVRFPMTVLRIAGSILLLSRGFGLEVLFVLLAAYHTLSWGTYLFLLKRFEPAFRFQFNATLLRALAVQAIPFAAIAFTGETFKQIDRVFLSKLWDTTAVGIYSTGAMPVQMMYLLAPAVMSALFPVLSRAYVASEQRFSRLVSQLFKLILISTFPIAIAMIAFADPAIPFIFGQEYTASVAVLQILALGIIPSFAARLLFRTLLASNNERLSVRAAFVNSVSRMVLSVILIPRFGILGASFVAVCTELVGFAQNLFYVCRKATRFDFRHALLRPGACVLVSLPVYFFAMRWNSLLAWIISMGVFVGTLLVSRTITRQDVAALSIVRART